MITATGVAGAYLVDSLPTHHLMCRYSRLVLLSLARHGLHRLWLSAHQFLEFPPIGPVTVGQEFDLAKAAKKENKATAGPDEKKGEEGIMDLPPIRAMGLSRSTIAVSTGEKITDINGEV
jgi:hypothetical protein